jgi:hypothetical protein
MSRLRAAARPAQQREGTGDGEEFDGQASSHARIVSHRGLTTAPAIDASVTLSPLVVKQDGHPSGTDAEVANRDLWHFPYFYRCLSSPLPT